MRAMFKTPANFFSYSRLLMVPVLWVLALRGETFWLGIGLLYCGLSDTIDGNLARWLKQTSPEGAKIDSIADHLVLFSSVFWLLMLRPEMITENITMVSIMLTISIMALLVGIVKFRRFANLHLYSSKFAAVFLYALIVSSFIFGGYNPILFWIACLSYTVSSFEMLVLQLSQDHVDENMGSLLLVMFRGKEA